MCGIYTRMTLRRRDNSDSDARDALEELEHRGPHAFGVREVKLPWVEATLGMVRLKVVDQSDLPVPYDFRSTLGVLLAYNGEVYNWRELRAEISDAVQWTTQCDAEVVAAAWRLWGVKSLDRLNGMWGFVLVDVLDGVVFAARDRAGEKPLYWRLDDEAISFASEAKALVAYGGELLRDSCPDVDVFEFSMSECTPFEEVNSIDPGCYMLLQSEGDVLSPDVDRWWELPEHSPIDMSLEELTRELTPLIADAISIRYVSEVPVAIQLSGGLDSAIIQAVVNSDRLYCVDFAREGIDNLSAARLASQGNPVVPVSFTREDMMAALPAISWHLDFPATWSACCQWFMNARIAHDGNIVVLSGEGADELFGGYTRYRVLRALRVLAESDPHLAGYEELVGRTIGPWNDVMARMLNRGGRKTHEEAVYYVQTLSAKTTGSPETKMARVDFYTTMQVLLRMADRMSSAFSLEGRAPFLDYRIMELSAQIPEKFKVSPVSSKLALRSVAMELGVDKSIIHERTKVGLTIPKSWSPQGTWDRGWFKEEMHKAWIQAFRLEKEDSNELQS